MHEGLESSMSFSGQLLSPPPAAARAGQWSYNQPTPMLRHIEDLEFFWSMLLNFFQLNLVCENLGFVLKKSFYVMD